jgi:hypothetical protein
MKKIVLIVGACLLLCILLLTAAELTARIGGATYGPTEEAKERPVLQEVSRKTGKEFTDWLSLREYVWCSLLKEGMTKEEVENALSTVGEIRVGDHQIDFANKYLDENLSPILIYYDVGGPTGRLLRWSASDETNLGAPRASCEKQE